jgi:hypothetical protein
MPGMRHPSPGPNARAGWDRQARGVTELLERERVELRRNLALEPGLVALARMLACPAPIAAMALADRLASRTVHGGAAPWIVARRTLRCERFARGFDRAEAVLAACLRHAGFGTPFLREIDKGLAKSKMGIVLVAPALLERLRAEAGSIVDKELSALLARDQLIPVVHNTTYEALRDVSPMLASRNGLNTVENTMANVASKLAELSALPA